MKKKLLFAATMVASAFCFNAQAQSIGDVITYNDVEYKVVGTNIIDNGSFDEGVNGWFTGDWVSAPENMTGYTLSESGGFDDGAFITISAGGKTATSNLRGSWAVTEGKTYLFRCYTSGQAPSSNNLQYSKLMTSPNGQDEGSDLYRLKWGASDVWTENNFVFTASSPYVVFRSSWNENSKLDGFALVEVAVNLTSLWSAALAAAEEVYGDPTYSNVSGNESDALYKVITDYSTDPGENYQAIADEIYAAIAAFKDAKEAYDNLVEINNAAAMLGLEEIEAVTAGGAWKQAMAQNVLVYNKVNSDYTFPVTLGTNWTTTGASKQEKSQHWNGDAGATYYEPNQWGSASVDWSMAQTLAGLPAGDYVLMATGRRSGDITMTMSAAGESVCTFPNAGTGIGVDTSGAANFSDGDFANNGEGWGWQWRYIPFTLTEDGDVEIKVTATAPSTHQWCSICEFRLLAKPEAETAIAKAELLAAINEANEVDTDFNVGEGVFQKVPSSAEDFLSIIGAAQETYDDPDATVEVVEATTEAVKQAIDDFANAPLNAPEADNLYAITIVTDGHSYFGNAIVAGNGATSANNPTGYIYNVRGETPYLAQAFTFTSAEDAENPNDYYISIELPEGTVYLTNGTNNGSAAGWAPSQIQGTTDSSAKMAFRIAASPTVEGAFNIYNPATGYKVIAQDGGNIYTDEGAQQNGEFTLADPTVTEVATAIAAGKFATRIYPFVPQPISGVTFYTCADANEKELVLEEATELEANTPYILYAESDVNEIEKGHSVAGEATYTDGWLTGTFAAVDIPVGSYVLQTLDGTQAFYIVEAGETAYKATPFRAYLSIPEEEQGEVKAYTLGGIATAINTLEALTSGNFEGIYNAAGTKLNRMEKGVNIIRMNDGTTRKVMIK